jgi:hypothetical protein
MRPTKGEMSVTFASAHATAWWMPKSSVRLQWMPSFSSLGGRMPSHVAAILMRTRSLPMPAFSYMRDEVRAFSMVFPGVERQARVDLGRDATGHDLQDLEAELDGELDRSPSVFATVFVSSPFAVPLASPSARSTSSAYSGITAAAAMSDGFVVASRGLNARANRLEVVPCRRPRRSATERLTLSCFEVELTVSPPATGVSLAADLGPMFATRCNTGFCHNTTNQASALDLTPAKAHAQLVGIKSKHTACASFDRVVPGSPQTSFLIFKLQGNGACFAGVRMPKGMPALSAAQLQQVRDWISEGANNN